MFLSQGQDLIASGAADRVAAPQQELAAAAAEFFSSQSPVALPRLLVGALPFDGRQLASLTSPSSVTNVAPAASLHLPGSARAVVADPSPAAYRQAVTRALERMGDDSSAALRKVVLSRRLSIEFDRPLDPLAIVERLRSDRQATTFCVPLPADQHGPSRVLVGATPELLLAKRGSSIQSLPLAGSARRNADAALDRAAAEGLLQSAKDLREHAAVVEWIADTLSPHCRTLTVPPTPGLVSTAAMWHLGSQIAGELSDPGMSSIELVARLHPTPAVGGTPHAAAMAAIAELEPFDRGFFGGVVGWCDSAGDGRWMVAIRCGEICGRTAHVYAGAGIVPGSDPESETEETSAKLTTFLRALGIDESGRSLEDQR